MTAPFSEFPALSQEEKAWRLAIAAGWPISLVFAAIVAGNRLQACGFYFWTGQPCPFCGGTRAYLALASLDIVAAWRHSASAVLAISFGAAHTAFLLTELAFGVRFCCDPLWVIGWLLIGCLVAAYWAIHLFTG